jgi:[acyl-carrier-protein] S-malonyltransferase
MPEAVAGHSLGEFAALCCAGAYSLEDGFRIIKARAKTMEEAAGAAPGAMYAIIGGDAAKIAAACEEADGFVVPVNFNLPTQTVISGEEDAAIKAAEALAAAGARTVRLNVSSAFHTKLMQPAADAFKADISGISFSAPTVDFYSNLTGGKYTPEDFPEYFAAHMVSPVRFVEEVAAISADGIEVCVELGPGKAGSTLVKKNIRGMTVANVESPEGLAFFQ